MQGTRYPNELWIYQFSIFFENDLHHKLYFMEKLLENSISINVRYLKLSLNTINLIKSDFFENLIEHCNEKTIHLIEIDTAGLSMDLLFPYIEIMCKSTVFVDSYYFYCEKIPSIKGKHDKLIIENISHLLNRSNNITVEFDVTCNAPSKNIATSALTSNYFKSCRSLRVTGGFPKELIKSFQKFETISIENASTDGLKRLCKEINDYQSIKKLNLINHIRHELPHNHNHHIIYETLHDNHIVNTMLSSFKYLQMLDLKSYKLTTTSLYKILQVMFLDDSHLNHVELRYCDFSVRVSEEEEEMMRNHLRSFDYVSHSRDFTIGIEASKISTEVFQPIFEILKFSISVRMECREKFNMASFEKLFSRKASEWRENETVVLLREIKINGKDFIV